MRRAGAHQLLLALVFSSILLCGIGIRAGKDAIHNAYETLSGVAHETAWSGQTAYKESGQDGSGDGYYTTATSLDPSEASSLAAATWSVDVQELNLNQGFSNLTEVTTVTGNKATVTATGIYTPPWLGNVLTTLSKWSGQAVPSVGIPMKVVATGGP